MSEKYLGSPFLMDMAKYFYGILLFVRKQYRQPASFTFENREYAYFEHPYNGTWMNERALEIPLAWTEIQSYSPNKVLEVGNVLSHYFEVKHPVVDKYEQRLGVISKDIMDVSFDHKFDCIISISTIEHIGWDEIPRVPEKCIWAIEEMKQMLSENGRLFITIPLGYNTYLDKYLFDGKIEFSRVYFFKRLNRYEWQESGREQVLGSTYGRKYRSTDGLAICVWNRM